MLQAYAIAGGKLAPASADAGALGSAVWIDVSEPTGEEQATLEQALGIKLRVPEEPSRFQVSSPLRSSDGSVTLTALLLTGLAERRPRLVTVSFVLGGGPLITVTKGGAGGLGWLAREGDELTVTNSADAFPVLLDLIVEHVTDTLDHVGEQLDRLNRTLFQHRATRRLRERIQASPRRRNRQLERILTELGYYREVLVKLRRSVLSFHRVVSLAARAELRDGPGPAARSHSSRNCEHSHKSRRTCRRPRRSCWMAPSALSESCRAAPSIS